MLTVATFHLPSVLLAVFSWSSLYMVLRRWEPQRKAEWHCRIVTVIHATLITLITAWAAFVEGPWPFTDAGGPNTPLQVTATTICLGYFLFDFAWCLYFQTEGFTMLLHHSLSIVGLTWTLMAGKYGTEMMATICGSEVTNPLLQLRWFLRETNNHQNLLGEVVDLSFMLSFFLIRIGVGSLLLYCYFQQDTDFMGRLGAISIYLISWMFWISIVRYALYKYGKRFSAWQARRKPGGRGLTPFRASSDDSTSTSSVSTTAGAPVLDDQEVHRDISSAHSKNGLSKLNAELNVRTINCAGDGGFSLKGNSHFSGGGGGEILSSALSLSENRVRHRVLNGGLSHCDSGVLDQLGLTG